MNQVSPSEKLPVLYLMDSICKNVGKAYIALFSKNLVNSFTRAFDAVDVENKRRFSKVLGTWRSSGRPPPLFPLPLIVQIEQHVMNSRQNNLQPNQRPAMNTNPNSMNIRNLPPGFRPSQQNVGLWYILLILTSNLYFSLALLQWTIDLLRRDLLNSNILAIACFDVRFKLFFVEVIITLEITGIKLMHLQRFLIVGHHYLLIHLLK
jgi:hypothetical protein